MLGVLLVLSACLKRKNDGRQVKAVCGAAEVAVLGALSLTVGGGPVTDATVTGAVATGQTYFKIGKRLAVFTGTADPGTSTVGWSANGWFSVAVDSDDKITAGTCETTAETQLVELAKILKQGVEVTGGVLNANKVVEGSGSPKPWAYNDAGRVLLFDGTGFYKLDTDESAFVEAGAASTLAVAAKIVSDSSITTPPAEITWFSTAKVVLVRDETDTYVAKVVGGAVENGADAAPKQLTFVESDLNTNGIVRTDAAHLVLAVDVYEGGSTSHKAIVDLGGDFFVATCTTGVLSGVVAAGSTGADLAYVALAKGGKALAEGSSAGHWKAYTLAADKIVIKDASNTWVAAYDATDGVTAGDLSAPTSGDQVATELGIVLADLGEDSQDLSRQAKKVGSTGGIYPAGAGKVVVQHLADFYLVGYNVVAGPKWELVNTDVEVLGYCETTKALITVLGGTVTESADGAIVSPGAGTGTGDLSGCGYATATDVEITVTWVAGGTHTFVGKLNGWGGLNANCLGPTQGVEVSGNVDHFGPSAVIESNLQASNTEAPEETTEKAGSKAGLIAGVTVAAVVVVGAAAFLVYWFVLKKGAVGGGDAPAGDAAADAGDAAAVAE
jgi:hypothetical protein